MKKDEYISAISKIKASDKFKAKVETSMKSSTAKANTIFNRRIAPVFAALFIVACIGAAVLPRLQKGAKELLPPPPGNDSAIIEDNPGASSGSSLVSTIFIDGYIYEYSMWLRDSELSLSANNYEEIKGELLGEVKFDLMANSFTGTPPDFASNLGIGTKVYSIKNVKKERAVLAVTKDSALVLYRQSKALSDENGKIDLTLSQVFNMMSDNPTVEAVEMLDEMDGSWKLISETRELLSIINKEMPKLQILDSLGADEDPTETGKTLYINLVFPDGASLHMQISPESQSANVFGGVVRLSPELSKAFEELLK